MSWPRVAGERIAESARALLGTPYHDGGRLPGVGLDCLGVVIAAHAANGVPVVDRPGATSGDLYSVLVAAIERHASEVAADALEPGDILLFRGRSIRQHCGVYVGGGDFVHAYSGGAVRQVMLEPLEPRWRGRLTAAYRYRGAL